MGRYIHRYREFNSPKRCENASVEVVNILHHILSRQKTFVVNNRGFQLIVFARGKHGCIFHESLDHGILANCRNRQRLTLTEFCRVLYIDCSPGKKIFDPESKESFLKQKRRKKTFARNFSRVFQLSRLTLNYIPSILSF
jgi:hypothetical protein